MIGLQLELGSSPVSPLGVVSNGVPGFHPHPLGNGSILPLLLGKLFLDSEGFMRGLCPMMGIFR